jgi:hypothetical protein
MGRSIVAVTSKEEIVSPIEKRQLLGPVDKYRISTALNVLGFQSSTQTLFFLTWVLCLIPSTQLPALSPNMKAQERAMPLLTVAASCVPDAPVE